MKVGLIALGILAYFVVAGIVYETAKGEGSGEDFHIFFAALWPISVPVFGLVGFAIGIAHGGIWLVKKLREWRTRPARVAKALNGH